MKPQKQHLDLPTMLSHFNQSPLGVSLPSSGIFGGTQGASLSARTTPYPRARGIHQTRERLRNAAKAMFSRHGYVQASVREIARKCGDNSSLVVRYFVSKQTLFNEAVADMTVPAGLLGGERSTLGIRLARSVIEPVLGEDESNLLQLIVRSANDGDVVDSLRHAVDNKFIAPLAAELGGEGATERANVIVSLLMGGAMQQELRTSQTPNGDADQKVIETIAMAIQALVDPATRR